MAESDASLEELLKDMIGKPTGRSRVVVERGPVSQFATAVGSTSPIYHDLDAAKAAGFSSCGWHSAPPFNARIQSRLGFHPIPANATRSSTDLTACNRDPSHGAGPRSEVGRCSCLAC